MPRVFKSLDCRLILVGADPTEEVRAATQRLKERVELAGFVDDLTDTYGSSRVFVAPHRFAAGIPLKVVEAMSYGVPCIVSQLLAEQLGAEDGVEVMVARDTGEFVRKVALLYQDESSWRHIQEGALAFVHRHYDPKTMKDSLVTSLERSIENQQAAPAGSDAGVEVAKTASALAPG
jgi:glycosyltransferase involved in cell wall biosynthesis